MFKRSTMLLVLGTIFLVNAQTNLPSPDLLTKQVIDSIKGTYAGTDCTYSEGGLATLHTQQQIIISEQGIIEGAGVSINMLDPGVAISFTKHYVETEFNFGFEVSYGDENLPNFFMEANQGLSHPLYAEISAKKTMGIIEQGAECYQIDIDKAQLFPKDLGEISRPLFITPELSISCYKNSSSTPEKVVFSFSEAGISFNGLLYPFSYPAKEKMETETLGVSPSDDVVGGNFHFQTGDKFALTRHILGEARYSDVGVFLKNGDEYNCMGLDQ
ncbi:MAG: hypothetical protein ACRCYY_02710 [Trueperaceae bacterium]